MRFCVVLPVYIPMSGRTSVHQDVQHCTASVIGVRTLGLKLVKVLEWNWAGEVWNPTLACKERYRYKKHHENVKFPVC
jgi:hypothetical protein